MARHRKARQRARDAVSRARRLSQEEAEKPWELLSIMKSQSWLPKKRNVRQFLCVDPCCQICGAATLEIQQLLESEKSRVSPALVGCPWASSSLETLSTSSVSLERDVEPHHRRSWRLSPGTLAPTKLTDTVRAQQCWADHLQLDQKSSLTDMPIISETMDSSRLKDSMVLMIEKKIIQSKPKFDQESQVHHPLKSSVSLLSLDPKITDLRSTMSVPVDSALSSHVPLLSPEVCRLLELHVKKWIHFQKWGLPRRVEESLRQLMPDPTSFCRSRKKPPPSILSSGSEVTMDRTGTIPHQTQPTQSCWVSKWSVINLRQGKRWHQMHTHLPSREVEYLSGLYPSSKANDSGSNLQSEYYSQLFCGLPSLHSESLGVASLSSEGVSKNKNVPKPSATDPQPTNEISLSVVPRSPCKPASPSSPVSPNAQHPPEHEGTHFSVPFLTLAECEALECHLLERQVKLQWGLPAVYLRNWNIQSPMLHEPHGKAKIIKASWPRKPFLRPTREFSFPDHCRRLLEFHLQKQLIYLRWGLPQRIQRSVHLLLSSPDQQSRSCSSGALPNMSIPQPGNPEADGSGDISAPAVDKGSVPVPHLFTRAKAMLKSHVDSKCNQIHQGKVPVCVQSSWKSIIPGSLSTTAPCSWIPQSQSLALQAGSKRNPDLHHKIVPWKPASLSQEKQATTGALIEHCRRPQSLSEETIKKLETTLHHKYLAFLSGLPALYCVALSRPTSPAVSSQPRITEMKSRPGKSPSEALTQMTSLRDSLEPCTRDDDDKASEGTVGEVQPESQVEESTVQRPPKSLIPDNRNSLNTHSLAKLNFHLKKKVLAMQFGVSEKEREFKEPAVVNPETESIQEFLKSLGIPKRTALQKLPGSGDSPPAPDANRAHLKEQSATAAQTVGHKQMQPRSTAVPHGSVSKASQVRDRTEAQVPCVPMETREEKPNLEEPFSTEPQSPGKSKDSAPVPTQTEKSKEPEKPKAGGDLGEGDADYGLSPTSEKTHSVGDQKSEERPLHRIPQSSSQQRHSFPPEDPCPPSPQHLPEPEFPDPPPEVFMEREPEHDKQQSQTKVTVSPKPARLAEVPQLVGPKASKDLPFPRRPIQGKPFRGQTWQHHTSRGQVMPTSPCASPSLPETGFKNKMKSFLHSINPKIKGKIYMEPMVTTPGKVARTRKGSVDQGPPQAKSPSKKTKTENFRGPKAQSASSETSVIASLLTAPHILDSKLQPCSQQYGSVSVPGQPRHCPRHCPRLAYTTQKGNPL